MIYKKFSQTGFIAQLTILSDTQFIPQAQEFVLFYARLFKFNKRELHRIELITEEALVNTIQHIFGEEELGTIDIKLLYKTGKFIISIEDRGIPVDFSKLEKHESSALGIHLMKNLADEFQFINLGKEGKKLELVKNIPEESISHMLSKHEKHKLSEEAELAEDEPSIRIISHDDPEMLARLAYRVYGYTYFSIFYYPEQIRELIEKGLLVSAVAINKENEIVGNLSLFFETKGARVADSGAAMVDPRYRGHKLFKKMKLFLKDYAINNNMYGIYSEAVTIHTFTQQGNISIGAKETGIMLAFATESLTFKKVNNDKTLDQRQAVVLFYLKTNNEPHRKVYLCKRFYPILKKVYNNMELDREIIQVDSSISENLTKEQSLINTSMKPDFNIATISIIETGKDALEIVGQQLKEFCLNKVDTIYLEIPVDSPYSAVLADKVTELGFMLSGIIPELRDGDCLKLQYLNNVRVDPAKINIKSDLGKELLQDVMKLYK